MASKKITIRPRAVIMLLILIVGIFSLNYFKQELKLQEKSMELVVLEQQLQDKKTRNNELQNTINYYQSEEYKEEMKQREIDKVADKIVIFKEK